MDVGTGTTITYASGFCAEILSITPPGLSREAIETTHMGTTTAKTFMPGDLYDGGELGVSMAFAPGTTVPITSAAETVTVTFPDGATWAFSGFMTGFEATVPLEDKMTGDATIKVTGALNQTAGS